LTATGSPMTTAPKRRHLHAADLRGLGRLAIDATLGVMGLVETMHHNISRVPGPLGKSTQEPTTGVTGFVYRSIRGMTQFVGGGVDMALAKLGPLLGKVRSTPQREAVIAALNGVLGDHLAESRNPLAIRMRLRRRGKPLEIERAFLSEAIPRPEGRILLAVHGLCMNDLQWKRNGHDHGASLAADPSIAPRYTLLCLHYNSGRHVSLNGREFARLLDALVEAWPVPVTEIAFLTHSMGGLVTRSALHHAGAEGHRWPALVRKIVFLGTPHDGAPLERGGNWVDVLLDGSPYTTAFSRLGKIRSAGITDLRHGSLVDGDWGGKDRFAPSTRAAVKRHFVPLPAGVQCFAVAASLSGKSGGMGEELIGDGLVPVRSALGKGTASAALDFPADRQWVGYGMNHLDLLDSPAVYSRLRRWLS
ncbi:MAG: GPI inositol-deacylase, partial [Lysobacter sp.]|nr:GPI inositol-deacylase [Lysobacter sp.]